MKRSQSAPKTRGRKKVILRPMKKSARFVVLPSADAGNRNYSMIRKATSRNATKPTETVLPNGKTYARQSG